MAIEECKTQLEDLAIFSGQPAFPEKLHVGRPNIGDRSSFLVRVNDLLDRRWLSNNGPFVQEFELKIAGFLGVKHCIAICNGTVALEIAIRAAGLRGEVILPSFTFVATAHALQWQEISPVFCDIDPQTHNLDPELVISKITPRTSGIIGVHLWGRPCNIEALDKIARDHRLVLLFDASHAFGCSLRGQYVGGFGRAEVFSLHATKVFNAFEGGVIATNDSDLANTIGLMRNFGFSGYDQVTHVGTNGKMSEISAAMGLTSLESIDEFIAANRRNYFLYQDELAGIPGIQMVTFDEREKCNYQYVILEIDRDIAHLSRDQLRDVLLDENVLARRYFYPACHRMEPYRSFPACQGVQLPVTEWLCDRVLCVPTGTTIGTEEISRICAILRIAVRHGAAVSRHLASRDAKRA